MLPPEEPSPLSRRGALAGFPGIPVWLFIGSVGFVAWAVAGAGPGHPDWSLGVWTWLAVAYGLQVVGTTFGLLVPRVAAARAGRQHVPAVASWLRAYSWPVGIVILVVLLITDHGVPPPLTAWAAVATAYCFALDMTDRATLDPGVRRDATGRRVVIRGGGRRSGRRAR